LKGGRATKLASGWGWSAICCHDTYRWLLRRRTARRVRRGKQCSLCLTGPDRRRRTRRRRFVAAPPDFLDGMTAFFPWSTVTPKLHVLCCHAPAFLELFGSIGRYSEQGLESWHAHFNQNSRLYTEDTLLPSCLTYARRSAVEQAPGDDEQNRGKRRKPARAGPGARDAKRPDHKRTVAGRALAGCPRRESVACALKHAENCQKWARDNLGEAVRRIDAHRRRIGWTSTEAPAPVGDASSEEGDWHEAYLAAEAAEAASWMMLGGSPAAQ